MTGVAWLTEAPPWPWLLLAALAADAVLGDPAWLYRRVPHPVVVLGGLVDWLDRLGNRETWSDLARRLSGTVALVGLIVVAGSVGWALSRGLAMLPAGWLVEALVASSLLAQRSLAEHVLAVARELERGGLARGRRAVALIVGRDPESLDQAGVARAAIESCAENFSDGVVAPAFWYACLGLPGLMIYKAVNTADSMIGHRTPRHGAFGWASARFDDGLNVVPARLTGALIVLAAGSYGGARRAVSTMWRDAGLHRSPNAGWPEAAMAGALSLPLAGPRRYAETVVDDPWLGTGDPTCADAAAIRQAVWIMLRACTLVWFGLAAASVFVP